MQSSPPPGQMPAASGRTVYFDCLRILATVSVFMLHLAGQTWYEGDVNSAAWQIFNGFDSLVRWSVPVFVMISGALFLDRRTLSIRTLFRKNILRLVIAFLAWSAVYALSEWAMGLIGPGDIFSHIIKGPFHFWFLLMIVGVYLLIPLLKPITAQPHLTRYFLILSLVFTFLLPQVLVLLPLLTNSNGFTLRYMLANANIHFTLGYVFFFVCGYYLHTAVLSKWQTRVIYGLGVLGFLSTCLGTAFFSLWKQTPVDVFYEYRTVNVMLESVGVFVFAKNHLNFPNAGAGFRRGITTLSQYSFGAFLVHVLLIDLLRFLFDLHVMSFSPALSVPLLTLLVSVLSFSVSALLHRIPGLRRWVV